MGVKRASRRLRLAVPPWASDLGLALVLAAVALLLALGRPGSQVAIQVAVPMMRCSAGGHPY
jgi:hypothetical protein